MSDAWKAAGRYVAKLREDAGLTQAEVSEAVGLSRPQHVSAIERGNNRVAPSRMKKYAEVLGVDPGEFTRELFKWYSLEEYVLMFGGEEKWKDKEKRRGSQRGSGS